MRAMLMLAAGLALVGGGCKKVKPKPVETPATTPAPPPTPPTTPAAAGTQYEPGAGAIQNARKAAERTQLLAMMSGLALHIVALDTQNGRMPTRQELYDSIKDVVTERPLVEKINDGTIILTGSTDRSGLWAYEKGAEVSGGVALIAGSAQRYAAEDIQKFLRGR
jgi:hypothetical protein